MRLRCSWASSTGVTDALGPGRDEPPPLAARAVVTLAQDDLGVVLVVLAGVVGLVEVENGAVGHGLDEVQACFALGGRLDLNAGRRGPSAHRPPDHLPSCRAA